MLLLDHAEEPVKKNLISGGVRCNFTNMGCLSERFLSANPHFACLALARYTQHDFVALMKKRRIAFHEKTLGQLFCDGSARQVVAMLRAEYEAADVDLHLYQRHWHRAQQPLHHRHRPRRKPGTAGTRAETWA